MPAAWPQTDQVIGQFAGYRTCAPAAYAEIVLQGIAEPGVWDGLCNLGFRGSEAFVRRYRAPSGHPERLREAMARPVQFGAYSMQQFAYYFGVT